MAVADDPVEDAFLRHQVALILGHERAGLAQFDRVADFGVALVPHGQGVDRLLEILDQRFRRGQFGQVPQGVRVSNSTTIEQPFLFGSSNSTPRSNSSSCTNALTLPYNTS